MEAGDDTRRIRHLPPDTPEGTPPPGPDRRTARWIPLAGAGLAVALLVGSAAFYGGTTKGGDAGAVVDPSTSTSVPEFASGEPGVTTTTTTTLPPPLGRRIPDLDGLLAIGTRTVQGGQVLLWGVTEREPRSFPLSSRPDVLAFDASGDWVAYLSYRLDDASMYVGVRSVPQPVQFLHVTGFKWHPTAPLRLAWVADVPLEPGRTALFQGIIDRVTGDLLIAPIVADVPQGASVAGWGDWGFAVQSPSMDVGLPSILTILDATGAEIRSAPVRAIDVVADGTMLLASDIGAYDYATTAGLSNEQLGLGGDVVDDLPEGLYIAGLDLVPVSSQPTFTGGSSTRLAPDGKRILEVGSSTDRLAIATQDVEGRITRIVQYDAPGRVLGFTTDGRFIGLQDANTGDLVLIDWRTGVRFVAPLEDPGDILEFSIG